MVTPAELRRLAAAAGETASTTYDGLASRSEHALVLAAVEAVPILLDRVLELHQALLEFARHDTECPDWFRRECGREPSGTGGSDAPCSCGLSDIVRGAEP